MKRKMLSTLLVAGAFFTSNALAQDTVSVSGSTSVTEVMEVLAENYQKKHQGVFIEVQGTGSSAGVKAAKNGTSMLGMSSRDLKENEKEPSLKETVIAKDGIAIVVHNTNTLKDLSVKDIAKIYRGEIKKWSQIGGSNKPIVVVTRDTASGTRGAFEDIMELKRKINGISVSAISQRAQVGHGNGAVKTIVANNPNAIGYISLGSVDGSLKALKVDGTAATTENVISGTYKVARPFLVLTKDGKPSESAKNFLSWIISNEGQEIVKNQGYVPIK